MLDDVNDIARSRLRMVGWQEAEITAILAGLTPTPAQLLSGGHAIDFQAVAQMSADGAAECGYDPVKMAQLGLALVGMAAVVTYRLGHDDIGGQLHGAAGVLADTLDAMRFA